MEAKRSLLTHRPTGRSLRFGEMVASAATVKLENEPKPKTPAEFTLMGTRVSRLDTGMKVRGDAIFSIDLRLPDMVYASVRLRPSLNSALDDYDFDSIRHAPGVIAAVALRGIGGQDGVAIVADSWWRAEAALKKMPIRWATQSKAPVSSAAVLAEAGEIAKIRGTAIIEDVDAREVFANAEKTFAAVYQTPMQTHAPLETVNCTAQFKPDRLDIWVGTQAPEAALKKAATAAGLSADKVFLHNFFVGGGFGGRAGRGEIEQVVAIAKALGGQPIKLIWPREEECATTPIILSA